MDVVTVRLVGHYVGDPQVYRPKNEARELRESRDPIELLRAQLGFSDDEFESLDREIHEIVDGSVEFAKNGTDPKPEDALQNVYVSSFVHPPTTIWASLAEHGAARLRPQSRPYLAIQTLPASWPDDTVQSPETRDRRWRAH